MLPPSLICCLRRTGPPGCFKISTTIAPCPLCAALCSAVKPHLSVIVMSTSASRSALISSRSPSSAAYSQSWCEYRSQAIPWSLQRCSYALDIDWNFSVASSFPGFLSGCHLIASFLVWDLGFRTLLFPGVLVGCHLIDSFLV